MPGREGITLNFLQAGQSLWNRKSESKTRRDKHEEDEIAHRLSLYFGRGGHHSTRPGIRLLLSGPESLCVRLGDFLVLLSCDAVSIVPMRCSHPARVLVLSVILHVKAHSQGRQQAP